jgi:hypothetical protein
MQHNSNKHMLVRDARLVRDTLPARSCYLLEARSLPKWKTSFQKQPWSKADASLP